MLETSAIGNKREVRDVMYAASNGYHCSAKKISSMNE